MASRIALLLLLGVICVGFASAQIAQDCCIKVAEKRLPLQILQSYTIQDAGQGCSISATVFVSKVGKTLCVPHPNDKAWVKSYIRQLNQKHQRRH
ncbi:C-C motif chemokine 21-like [Trematomus bernacchii]|uniref:C-C motif chemokine 21-like n=1 Tax=Trematomus bernacchii TaxID=40690 RepID=UPI00146ED253|nr:C-C motif chemokine 21-like [Trematomus bernacchii]